LERRRGVLIMAVLSHGLDKGLNQTTLRAQLRDHRTRTCPYPGGMLHPIARQYGRPSQFGEAPGMSNCCKSTTHNNQRPHRPKNNATCLLFSQEHRPRCLELESTTTLLATMAISNPWTQSKIMRDIWVVASSTRVQCLPTQSELLQRLLRASWCSLSNSQACQPWATPCHPGLC
jgi:hypothetical protein